MINAQQAVTISKSKFDELINRLERLEKAVFKKDQVANTLDLYKKEKNAGKLKKMKSIDELFASE